MHLEGEGYFGDRTLIINTLAAVEIEEVPALTYAHNFEDVNVITMGITRFLSTARRLIKLKGKGKGKVSTTKSASVKVLDMRINKANATKVRMPQEAKASTKARQDKDNVALDMFLGDQALPWLEFQVLEHGFKKCVHTTDPNHRDIVIIIRVIIIIIIIIIMMRIMLMPIQQNS
jgi:hypothetical protein